MTTLYAPARAGLAIPMPDRGNRLMDGPTAVDAGLAYYRRLIADGDIVAVDRTPNPKAARRGRNPKRA